MFKFESARIICFDLIVNVLSRPPTCGKNSQQYTAMSKTKANVSKSQESRRCDVCIFSDYVLTFLTVSEFSELSCCPCFETQTPRFSCFCVFACQGFTKQAGSGRPSLSLHVVENCSFFPHTLQRSVPTIPVQVQRFLKSMCACLSSSSTRRRHHRVEFEFGVLRPRLVSTFMQEPLCVPELTQFQDHSRVRIV